jgi:hypothetical protein
MSSFPACLKCTNNVPWIKVQIECGLSVRYFTVFGREYTDRYEQADGYLVVAFFTVPVGV